MTVARSVLIVSGLTMALAVSGCGASSSNSAGATSASAPAAASAAVAAIPRACDVLNDAVAKKFLGPTAVLKRDAQPNPKMTQCQYGSDNGLITIMVGPWDMVHTSNPEDKPAAGLGDEAYDAPDGLDVRKGDRGINIDVMVASGEFWGSAADAVESQTIAAEHKVAPDLLARL